MQPLCKIVRDTEYFRVKCHSVAKLNLRDDHTLKLLCSLMSFTTGIHGHQHHHFWLAYFAQFQKYCPVTALNKDYNKNENKQKRGF